MKYAILFFSLILLAAKANANPEQAYPFSDPMQQQTFQQLINELRCLVCQNQNLADSNAPLAQDLRQQIYQQLQAGQSREQVIDYLVARYGEFILYQPPWQWNTMLLWVGPFLFLSIGFIWLWRRAKRPTSMDLTSVERQRLEEKVRRLDQQNEAD